MNLDFQHPIKYLNNFIKLFNIGKNIVIGERNKIRNKSSKHRLLITYIGNILSSFILKRKINLEDPLSGFFGGSSILFSKEINKDKTKFVNSGYKFLFDCLKLAD